MLTALALTACSHRTGPVAVALPSASAVPSGCTALSRALPQTLEGRTRRATSPVSPLVTAWGSPAVILRCGTGGGNDQTGTQLDVDGVTWRTVGPQGGAVVWATVGTSPGVELSVPSSDNDQESLLADLGPAVKSSLSRVPAPPSASPTPGAASRSAASPTASGG